MELKNHQVITSKPLWSTWNGLSFWNKLVFLPRIPLLLMIWIYQKTLSPDHGLIKVFFKYGYCRFHPSCSEYGWQVIYKYGLISGIPKMIWRVIRCNPWNNGGIDLP